MSITESTRVVPLEDLSLVKDVKLSDLNPVNKWEIRPSELCRIDTTKDLGGLKDKNLLIIPIPGQEDKPVGQIWEHLHAEGDPLNRRYLNEPDSLVRKKCALLTIGTPTVIAAKSVANVCYRTLKIVTLSHFWRNRKLSVKDRFKKAGRDIARVIASPIALVAMESAAIYGLIKPKDGRKLYATLERAEFGTDYLLAPCFQPTPQKHLGIIQGYDKDGKLFVI